MPKKRKDDMTIVPMTALVALLVILVLGGFVFIKLSVL